MFNPLIFGSIETKNLLVPLLQASDGVKMEKKEIFKVSPFAVLTRLPPTNVMRVVRDVSPVHLNSKIGRMD